MCSNPPTVANAVPSRTDGFDVNDAVTYTCDAGYQLDGVAVLICQSIGIFLPNPPTCLRSRSKYKIALDCKVLFLRLLLSISERKQYLLTIKLQIQLKAKIM